MSLITALAGGMLIGLSAVFLMLTIGRIAGISGIVGGLFGGDDPGDRGWRPAFLLGLVAGPFAAMLCGAPRSEIAVDAPVSIVVLAGLLVGFGTRLGCGCTSGHGVCGLARLSPRSLWATLTFMAVGVAIVFVVRHLLGG